MAEITDLSRRKVDQFFEGTEIEIPDKGIEGFSPEIIEAMARILADEFFVGGVNHQIVFNSRQEQREFTEERWKNFAKRAVKSLNKIEQSRKHGK